MSNEQVRALVNALLEDQDLYRQAKEKEKEVWGNLISDKRRNQALQDDRNAAAALRLHRDLISLPEMLRKHNIKPSMGLSLACGEGRVERILMEKGICSKFHGIDVSPDALEEAKDLAKKHHFHITYEKADLNEVYLRPNAYDLVVTQNCLHHVLRLEHIAEQIQKSLKPDGILWIHDFIGETQFQYSDKRIALANSILAILPERFKQNKVNRKMVDEISRKTPGSLASPFEAIRSEEIMPIFLKRFSVVEKAEFSSILHLVCPEGTRGHFLRSEEGLSIFELLFFLDRLLVEEGILKPCGGIYMLRPKKQA
jgi:2-polyprenyl-3-methyl-5-hydroxy-6-metoxy-1,4-benzoquinol methylase